MKVVVLGRKIQGSPNCGCRVKKKSINVKEIRKYHVVFYLFIYFLLFFNLAMGEWAQ